MFSGKRFEANSQYNGSKSCYCYRENSPPNGILKSVTPAQPSCGSTRVTKTKIVVPEPIDDHRTIKVQVSRNKMKKRPFKPAPARYSPRALLRTRHQPVAKTVPEKPSSPAPTLRQKSDNDSINAPWSEILAKQSNFPSNDAFRGESENEMATKSRSVHLRKDRGSQTFDLDNKIVEAVNVYVKNRGVQCYLPENGVVKPKQNSCYDFTISCFEEALLQRLISRFKEELKIAKKEAPNDNLWTKSKETETSEKPKGDFLSGQREIESLKRQLTESHKREAELKSAVDEAQKRVDAMSGQFAEFRQVILTNTERVRQLQAENRTLRRAEEALPEAIEEVDRLRTELSIATLDRDKARAYLSLKEDENAQLKSRLEKLMRGGFLSELNRDSQTFHVVEEPRKTNALAPTATHPKRSDLKSIQRSPSRSTSAGSIETLKATLTEVFDMIKKSAENMVKEAEFRQDTIKVNESGDFHEVSYGPADTISQASFLQD